MDQDQDTLLQLAVAEKECLARQVKHAQHMHNVVTQSMRTMGYPEFNSHPADAMTILGAKFARMADDTSKLVAESNGLRQKLWEAQARVMALEKENTSLKTLLTKAQGATK